LNSLVKVQLGFWDKESVEINRVELEYLWKASASSVYHKDDNKLDYALDEAGGKLANPTRYVHHSHTFKYLHAGCLI
jgi:hypothetical protein